MARRSPCLGYKCAGEDGSKEVEMGCDLKLWSLVITESSRRSESGSEMLSKKRVSFGRLDYVISSSRHSKVPGGRYFSTLYRRTWVPLPSKTKSSGSLAMSLPVSVLHTTTAREHTMYQLTAALSRGGGQPRHISTIRQVSLQGSAQTRRK
ncbi:hypothetical protein BD289DRAFT_90752 [Coniella lustricola]|uniref:Uncharacterized protein n=1 Tax=Coniella lustricola TaxID=2025994 RepID=A0A2T3AGZ3_9PEZI|nr:hypothetical protein BD289DRAFT_90752 [Coniella lustricola]